MIEPALRESDGFLEEGWLKEARSGKICVCDDEGETKDGESRKQLLNFVNQESEIISTHEVKNRNHIDGEEEARLR